MESQKIEAMIKETEEKLSQAKKDCFYYKKQLNALKKLLINAVENEKK